MDGAFKFTVKRMLDLQLWSLTNRGASDPESKQKELDWEQLFDMPHQFKLDKLAEVRHKMIIARHEILTEVERISFPIFDKARE